MIAKEFNPMDEPDHQFADHDWLALRYVGEEMSAAERVEFETLLAESQAAREAVATAVTLFATVPLAFAAKEAAKEAAAEPVQLSESSSPVARSPLVRSPVVRSLTLRARAVRSMSWMAVGAAACLVGMLAIHIAQNSLHWGLVGDEQDQRARSDLALQWTNLASQADSAADAIAPDANSDAALQTNADSTLSALVGDIVPDAAGDASTNDNTASDAAVTAELAAPSWLLAALAPAEAASEPSSSATD